MQTDMTRIVLNIWMRLLVGSMENCLMMHRSDDFSHWGRAVLCSGGGVWGLPGRIGKSSCWYEGLPDSWNASSPAIKKAWEKNAADMWTAGFYWSTGALPPLIPLLESHLSAAAAGETVTRPSTDEKQRSTKSLARRGCSQTRAVDVFQGVP